MPADLRLLPRLGRVSLRAEFQALAFGRASTLPNRPGGWSKVAWFSAEPKNQQVVSLRDPCFLASFCQNSSVTNAPRRDLEWPTSVASGRDAHNDPCAICFPSPTRQFLQVSLGRRAGANSSITSFRPGAGRGVCAVCFDLALTGHSASFPSVVSLRSFSARHVQSPARPGAGPRRGSLDVYPSRASLCFGGSRR